MAFTQTAAWWDSETEGRRHADMQLWELAEVIGEVNPNAWGKRRESGRAKFGKQITFASLSVGWAAKNAADIPAGRNKETPQRFKETVEIRGDGSCLSEKLIELTAEQCKDRDYLLQAHGFDPCEWEIISARNNIWNVYSKQDGVQELYASSITAKPLKCRFDIGEIHAALKSAVTPVKVNRPRGGKKLLELSFTDMHFGNSSMEWYKGTLARASEHITARRWAEIVIWVGSDLFHVDNFKNTTANGTPQSSVWWPDAVGDCMRFMGTVVELSLQNAAKVSVYYVPGNHDESMAWMFTLLLEQRYPQATFSTAIEERKVHTFGRCAIGMTHGDEKTRKDLDRVFSSEFPEFRGADHREVHMGHLHHETAVDRFGVISRSLPTSARTDKWHRESGFVGARKVFQLFQWDAECGVTDVHYV